MRITLALAGALALVACSPSERAPPQSAFAGRVDDWTREIVQDQPELASARALPISIAGPYRDRLDDRSFEAEERRRTAAIRRLTELRAFAPSDIPASQRRTYDVLSAQFDTAAELAAFSFGAFDPLGSHFPYVVDQQTSAFLILPDFFDTRHTIANFADAEAYVRRLRRVGQALDDETARARRDAENGVIAPDFLIDRTVGLLDAAIGTPVGEQVYVASLRRKLEALWPAPAPGETTTPDQRRDLDRAARLIAQASDITAREIIPAHQRQAAMLRSLRPRAVHDAGVWRLPNGDAYYRAQLRQQTTTDLTPDEIHDIGLQRVDQLNAQADIALRRVGLTEGTIGERLAQLTADPRHQYPDSEEGRAQLLGDVRARVSAIMQRAPQWFGTLPEAALEVRRVPIIQEAAQAGAYYDSPALDGSLPGIYYINLRSMAEMTRIDLPTQDFHEAVPGHHFQIALAQEQEGLPLLRRLMGFNAFAEGWGLYAEQLADENSFYETDHIGRIGYLRWQLWRAARLVVDTGMHAKRWSREEAIEYMMQTTGDALPVVVTEIERYAGWPGQACGYELGRREITRLREEARRALGGRFDQRRFHDAVLLGGEVPLTVLEQGVAGWIETERSDSAE